MTADALRMLRLACDFAMPLAMGLNLGLNVRADDNVIVASLDGDQITSSIVTSCPLSAVIFRRSRATQTVLWLGDTSIVLTPAEAASIEAFLRNITAGEVG
ncbi:hypothetical protein J2X57_002001 [Luteibacter sp. 1214]|uniref:hypothetical protein n=1 Tax=Luteibacter sp. 1214 TaxID=2817735 RepID=UPI0028633A03|nr:hypothetical protein [Luteibacter sp. 1214]MDR6642789.1 hypothetical protein [Luteibacter sp. 1214]